jgi:hypothetical protein
MGGAVNDVIMRPFLIIPSPRRSLHIPPSPALLIASS